MPEVEKNLDARLIDLEAQILEQDHRFIPVVTAYLASRRRFEPGDPRREAAFRALLWSLFFSPATVAISGTLVAAITLGVLVWQNLLVAEQNQYLRKQIDQQQVQIEGQQRIDNQTVRNTAIEQIFGPEFSANPRVRAEAVRSLIAVERSRIDAGINTLPTDWVNLHEADLTDAWLDSADLRKVSFRKSVLVRSNFNAANLAHSSIRYSTATDAHFMSADMREIRIAFSDLTRAQLAGANLERAAFTSSDLKESDLSNANLSQTTFYETSLQGVDLSGIHNWNQIESIEKSNIFGVRNAPSGFVDWALAHGAVSDDAALRDLREKRERSLRLEERSGSDVLPNSQGR